ncbi:MAG: hypothetical protein GX314_05340 [Clostridiaceae bacterium]|nr:hypothetical protein [Clostridiaceae bacterium]
MKKTQYKVLAFIIAALLLVSLVACGGSKSPIVGKWTPEAGGALGMDDLEMLGISSEDIYLEFTSGGKVEIMVKDKPFVDFMKDMLKEMGMDEKEIDNQMSNFEMKMTYKADGDKIKMEMDFAGEKESQEGTFKVDGDKLTITIDGEDAVFTKKK